MDDCKAVLVPELNYEGQFANLVSGTLGRPVQRLNRVTGEPIEVMAILEEIRRLADAGGKRVDLSTTQQERSSLVLFDNGVYGLTKGQTSPTSVLGFKTSTSPYDNQDNPLNPLMMLLSYGASWVGQAYAGRQHHLADMLSKAIAHRGFSYLHVLSPCVTFDKTSMTYKNLGLSVRQLAQEHDSSNLMQAMVEAQRQEKPALGVFFKEVRPTMGDGLDNIVQRAQGTTQPKLSQAG